MRQAARGEMPDLLPFAPRLDLWFIVNQGRGTLPCGFENARSEKSVAQSMGWALHKVIHRYDAFGIDAIIDRVLGIYHMPYQTFTHRFPSEVERKVFREGDKTTVEYRTPLGVVRGAFVYSNEKKRLGKTLPDLVEPVIKNIDNYAAVGYIFEHMQVDVDDQGYLQWEAEIGEETLPIVNALVSGSPIHHILKVLMDTTQFYFHFRDHHNKLMGLAEKIGLYFSRVLEVIAEGPAEAYMIGNNFDDMITYPDLFKEHILPWIQEGSNTLHNNGKLSVCHTDGENQKLMDLISESGIDIADSVTPAPMTKVSLAEYYRRWSDRITIFGGFPSILLLPEATSDDEFKAYMDQLFVAVAPGHRFILAVTDAVPPDADSDRLRCLSDMVEKRGQLPLKTVNFNPVPARLIEEKRTQIKPIEKLGDEHGIFDQVREDVLTGRYERIIGQVEDLLKKGVNATDILNQGLLSNMDVIGDKFKNGTVFIPEVLLSARVINMAVEFLEPHLGRAGRQKLGKIVIGTVKGDLHDIGKNIVITMLKSAGFEIIDLGINIPEGRFVSEVESHQPDILGLSALLTTTMPEMKKVIDTLQDKGVRNHVQVIVGGAPITMKYAQSIGADGFASDAVEALTLAKTLMIKKQTTMGYDST
jgi:corrinoid protein of di/trimethylamine methyltransferase